MDSTTLIIVVVIIIGALAVMGSRMHHDDPPPSTWPGTGAGFVNSSRGTAMQLPTAQEGTVVTRAFHGRPDAAAQDAGEYLAHVQPLGWREVSRTYTPGSYGCGAFLIALLLCIVLIGILVFIYMLIVKPAEGTLVVTYTRA